MSERNPLLLVDDMLESVGKILRYCDGLTFERFVENDMIVDAVI